MRRLISAVCAAALMASAAVVPATASPLVPQPRLEVNDSVVEVGSKKRRYHRKKYYRKRHHYKRRYRDDDWWIPGAIIGGLIIGGILSQPRYYRSTGNAHVRWCDRRFRSYRAWDNTFQPYHGPRKPCRSPYL